jgi:hypothetical protein
VVLIIAALALGAPVMVKIPNNDPMKLESSSPAVPESS